MQFKKLRRDDRKRNNRKEDSGFETELLPVSKYALFTGDTRAQSVLDVARASLAAGFWGGALCLCHPGKSIL